jgi:ribosomal protein S18 acetylase RimI-like enzyme
MGSPIKKTSLRRKRIQSVDIGKRTVRAENGVVTQARTLNHKTLGKLTQLTVLVKSKTYFGGSMLIRDFSDNILAECNIRLRKTKTFGREIEIDGLKVTPELRREGFFEQMLAEISTIAKKNKAGGITLEVEETNELARKVYEKMGFVKVRNVQKKTNRQKRLRLRLGL